MIILENCFLPNGCNGYMKVAHQLKQVLKKNENVLMGKLSKHCAICLNLNGCCFVKEKCPEIPLHPNCHCKVVEIQSIKANVNCPIEKFTKYVFVFQKWMIKKSCLNFWDIV